MTDAQQNYVVLGDTICEISQPTNAVRWLMRNGTPVLQQCWTATRTDRNGYGYSYQQWRDVPTAADGE